MLNRHLGIRPLPPARGRRRFVTELAVLTLGSVLASAPAGAVEVRNYVINLFVLATHPADDDCPQGVMKNPIDIARSSLLAQGLSTEEADRRAHEFNDVLMSADEMPEDALKPFAGFTEDRARINGKPVNAYLNPFAAPNPKIPKSIGRMQYGFNLDGKGANDKDTVEDPDTHERGVDNEYARAVGCMALYRFKTGTGAAPDAGWNWNENRGSTRATLVSVVGEDLSKDGEVLVLVRRSLDAVLLDGRGTAQPDVTFRIDQDPRTFNIFRAKLHNGVVSSIEPQDFLLKADPNSLFDYKLMRSRLRIQLKPDGAAEGMIGGYRPWRDIYMPFVTVATGWEYTSNVNLVGLFYNLRDYADGYPDAQGKNTAISSTWWFDAVPAFLVDAEGSLETLQTYESLFRARTKVAQSLPSQGASMTAQSEAGHFNKGGAN